MATFLLERCLEMKENVSPYVVKEIINANFTWGDVSKYYAKVSQFDTNCYCVFHDHSYTEGNAKFYYNDEKDIWTLYCFVEKKSFSVYDYVNLILCRNYQKYNSPLDFLKKNMSSNKLAEQISTIKNQRIELTESSLQKKIDYINNIAVKYDTMEEYIEELYTN